MIENNKKDEKKKEKEKENETRVDKQINVSRPRIRFWISRYRLSGYLHRTFITFSYTK